MYNLYINVLHVYILQLINYLHLNNLLREY